MSDVKTIARIGLLLVALVFVSMGVLFLVAPVRWAAAVEIALPTAMARTDMRATYGGFDLAVGVFLALCARRDAWLRVGVVAMGLVAAGFGFGRLTGILIEGTASPLMATFAIIETATVVFALVVLRRLPRDVT